MTGPATLVPLTTGHLDALMRHEREMFGTEAWSPASYAAEIRDKHSRYYLAVEDASGQLLGWGGLLIAADQAEVLTIGVVPSAQRRGLARLMLADFYAEARRRGARELFLEVRVDNAAAVALYESERFERIGHRRGYYDHGRVDGITMRRAL